MSSESQHEVVQTIIERFIRRTPEARRLDAQAKAVLPGGDSRTSTYYAPYPAYLERGEGCRVYDCDENEYIDFLNNFTTLIHGHAHPPTVTAIREQAERGTVLGSAARVTQQHAELLCSRIPSLARVRYCNSGTEATMMAIRAARAFTGKDAIVKMDGGYHGSHDAATVNLKSVGAERQAPRGVPASVLNDVAVVPFNDLEALESVLRARADLAAIIMEPFQGSAGGVDPQPGYLQGVRDLADRYGVLLIFDEVMSFRFHVGGLQAAAGVQPDLTTLGKIIGGGLPIGAFGGRAGIMAGFDPLGPKPMAHSGTFNANNITLAAGLATLQHYGAAEVDRVNALGLRLQRGMDLAFQAHGIAAHAAGAGSIVNIHWQAEKVTTARQAAASKAAARSVPRVLHLELLNRGVFPAGRLQFCTSTPMTEGDVDRAIQAFSGALGMLRPFIAEEAPHLLGSVQS